MKRRERKKGPPSTDLLVCFPTRAHLTLMPKQICSPGRHSESKKNPLKHLSQHRLRNSTSKGGGGGGGSSRGVGGDSGGGHASPYLWSKTKQMSSDNLSEPTSPKVTCAGQIKVRPRTGSCQNWQSVMEEIERLHNSKKKKSTWVETLGFKKEVMQFLACLRRVKFDFQCFGSFSNADMVTSDEEYEDKEDTQAHQETKLDHDDHDHDHHHEDEDEDEDASRSVFSKWLMVLHENQDCGVLGKDEKVLISKEMEKPMHDDDVDVHDDDHSCMPPSNALLLMRCRSAPAKSWLEEKQVEDENDDDDEHEHDDDYEHEHGHKHDDDDEHEHDDDDDDDEEKIEEKIKKKRESLMELMKYENDFYKLSCDIAKETWVIGGINKDPFSRSRSWKR